MRRLNKSNAKLFGEKFKTVMHRKLPKQPFFYDRKRRLRPTTPLKSRNQEIFYNQDKFTKNNYIPKYGAYLKSFFYKKGIKKKGSRRRFGPFNRFSPKAREYRAYRRPSRFRLKKLLKENLVERLITKKLLEPKKKKILKNKKSLKINISCLKLGNTYFIKPYYGKANIVKAEREAIGFDAYRKLRLNSLRHYNFNSENIATFKPKVYVTKLSPKLVKRLKLRKNLAKDKRILEHPVYKNTIKKGQSISNRVKVANNITFLQHLLTYKMFDSQLAYNKNGSLIKRSRLYKRIFEIQSKKRFKTIPKLMLVHSSKKRITYELRGAHYHIFKTFRGKFFRKRGYSKISRGKRLALFHRLMKEAGRNYRKLKRNFIFIKLMRANFKYFLGINEQDLLKKGLQVRRGNNSNSINDIVGRFNKSLQLKMDGLAVFLGFAPNRPLAQEFVRFGGMRVNGLVITDINATLACNDMLQVDAKLNHYLKALYKGSHGDSVRARLKYAQFLQIIGPNMLFMMVRGPHDYELFEESVLNHRGIRFFIRYFPVRISKYRKAKTIGYKYN